MGEYATKPSVAWLDNSSTIKAWPLWKSMDRHLEQTCSGIMQMLGITHWSCTEPLLRFLPGSDAPTLGLHASRHGAHVFQEGDVSCHMNFMKKRRLCFIHCVHGKFRVRLHHATNSDLKLQCAKGETFVFRHDRMGYSLFAEEETVVLQKWLLLECQQFAYQFGTHGLCDVTFPAPSAEDAVSVMSIDTMLPGKGTSPRHFTALLASGVDSLKELPQVRWDIEQYFEPDMDLATGKYYTRHAGMVMDSILMTFDAHFFGISPEEADLMDPTHRNSCQVGYTALYRAGWRRDSLLGAHLGCFFGNCNDDWVHAKRAGIEHSTQAASFPSAYVCSARLSHIFGMKGPTSTSDTACSSSLVACSLARAAMRPSSRRDRLQWSLVAGTNALLSPISFIGLSGPKMLSPHGRCFTFDKSADGFARGEGSTAITLHVEQSELTKRLAAVCGTCVNQDGRSASMTAPHGPSQQECILASLREARVEVEAVRVAELHGTGTALGDPIEVGALRSVMRKRKEPILQTSAKSNVAHGEANAGLAGVIKCISMLQASAQWPNVHLRLLNPHIDSTGYPTHIAAEICCYNATHGYSGVSSFGFGGTNARADLFGVAVNGPSKSCRRTSPLKSGRRVLIRCPFCLGGMEFPTCLIYPRATSETDDACLRADADDNYEMCSRCYAGAYSVGRPPWEEPIADNVSLLGTWSAWSQPQKMRRREDGTHVAVFRLGDAGMEGFRIILDADPRLAYYPACGYAGSDVRVLGPGVPAEGQMWIVDGRDDRAQQGTLYEVTFRFGDDTGCKHVSWIPVDPSRLLDDSLPSMFDHHYAVAGSWMSWRMAKMRQVRGEEGIHSLVFRIGVSGHEDFRFARDSDAAQLVYPAKLFPDDPSVPVRGPDSFGAHLSWRVRGAPGERVTLVLRVSDGAIRVMAATASGATQIWYNADRQSYSIAGSWDNWSSSSVMSPVLGTPETYTARVRMPAGGGEEFQVWLDGDRRRALHPDRARAPSGQGIVMGPSSQGDGFTFAMQGPAGVEYEITLSLGEHDKRRVVQWAPVQRADGTPAPALRFAAW